MNTDDTIYDRIGGEEGIAALIGSFYERIHEDPVLSPYFKNVPMDKLIRMQREFFAMATGGPAEYSGRPLSQVHKHLHISQPDFSVSQSIFLRRCRKKPRSRIRMRWK